jgi:hypothetical protein
MRSTSSSVTSVELRRPRARVVRYLRSLLKRAGVLEVDGERVARSSGTGSRLVRTAPGSTVRRRDMRALDRRDLRDASSTHSKNSPAARAYSYT